jgi:diaminohydroxyphosphoribosylaminopyrimidine deaminase/5-amino-6-(5-phosphoribosylamino)uracil reductase
MMTIALAMARRGLGRTAPNPAVGAVIADAASGEVVARGWTQPGGRPHAETEAIRRAGAGARGRTMYVTLEPCSHHGKTPPCADAIVAAGLAHVVAAIEDPDPRVAGRGLDRLRAAGIAVTRGVLAAEARWLTRGHIVRVTERRPFVTLKIAAAADGSVPRGAGGQPTWVTGPEARASGHLLRAEADAIVVGRGTVRDDDPELSCRLPGLAARTPVRVVLARSLDIAADARLVATASAAHPLWLVAAPQAAPAAALRRRIAPPAVRILEAAVVGDALWLPSVMEEFVAEGITRLLVEGGPTLWRAFAAARLVDEIHLYQSGLAGLDPAVRLDRARAALARHLGPLPLALAASQPLGADHLFVWRLAPSAARDAAAAPPSSDRN